MRRESGTRRRLKQILLKIKMNTKGGQNRPDIPERLWPILTIPILYNAIRASSISLLLVNSVQAYDVTDKLDGGIPATDIPGEAPPST